jgi:hypothetical protein
MRIVLVFLAFLYVTGTSCNNEKKTDKTETEKKETPVQAVSAVVKPHECTTACTKTSHVYVHNEIGHTCSSACGKTHICSDNCKGAAHVYAHGEAGHYCTCVPGT